MGTQFEFATATQIIFGDNAVARLPHLVAPHGQRALIVMGSSLERAKPALRALATNGIQTEPFHVAGEPTTEVAREGVARARDFNGEVVIGIGGGSVLDAGKAIAALLSNGGDPLDYVEVIGAGKKITQPSVAFFAVPTTAGTGSEVTRNAVLASEKHGVKVSLRSHLMLPRVALVDPLLTHTMSPSLTASTGLDALTQVLEPFVSVRANPLTDAICREGLRRAARSLERAFEHGKDAGAREDMALVSLFGGLALANAKLGAVHGFAAPIGGRFMSPHGAVCARLLPFVVEANVAALRGRAPNHPALPRYREVAELLTGRTDAQAEDGIAWLQELSETLKVPRLRTYGFREEHVDSIVRKAQAASSMKGNPIELTREELRDILLAAV